MHFGSYMVEHAERRVRALVCPLLMVLPATHGTMGYRKIVQADKNTTVKSMSKEAASGLLMLPQTKLEPNY